MVLLLIDIWLPPTPTRTPGLSNTPTQTPTPFNCTTESADIWGNGGRKDKVVNILDFSKLASEFGKTHSVADINRDEVVNILDFSCLRSHFNKRY